MIFKNISNLHTPSERAFFRELVVVYSKIVQEMCARNGKIFQVETFKTIPSEVIAELTTMGVISNESDILGLKADERFVFSISICR